MGQDSRFTNYDCVWVRNDLVFNIPPNGFNFTVKVPEGEVEEGTSINVEIEIDNKWRPVDGELQVYFEVPTVLSTPSTELNKKFVSIPLGKSKHTYTIPTGRVTDALRVKATLYILAKGSEFSKWNGNCYEPYKPGNTVINTIHDLASCQYVKLGVVTDDVTEITIIPRTTIIEIEKVIDCQTSTDCKIPKGCTGVTSQCLSNKTCQYNGQCYYKPETQSQSIWARIWAAFTSLAFFQWLGNLWV